MNTRFDKLMHHFQQNNATDEERRELMHMIGSGIYNEQIGEEWEKLLNKNIESIHTEELGLDRELRNIRSRVPLTEKTSNVKINRKQLSSIFGWVSAAAVVVIFLMMAVFWIREAKHPEMVHPDLTLKTSNTKTFSGKQFVTLPDGSTVILNNKSKLSYDASFGDRIREVHLSGEAYFDIAHNESVPFVVRTGKIKTRVLGTAFNVEAWPDKPEVKVTVTRGQVSVGDDQHVEELLPNEQLAVNTETQVFEKKKLDTEEELEWKSSFFVLDKVTMENAARQINERYDIEVFIENNKLKNCLVNGAFLENENVEHIISVICLAMNASYEMEGDKIKIIGGIGCE